MNNSYMNNTYVSCTYDTNICYNEWLFQVLRSNDKMMFVVYFFSLSKHVCPMGYSEQLHLSPKVLLYLYLLKCILPYQYLINTYKVSKWHIYDILTPIYVPEDQHFYINLTKDEYFENARDVFYLIRCQIHTHRFDTNSNIWFRHTKT